MNEYRDKIDSIFYRLDEVGNAVLLYVTDGMPVCSLDESGIYYPVNSDLGVGYDHPEGLVLSISDARRLGIPSEDDF